MDFKFSISEVSSRTGISSSAINYYVRSKVITPPKKTSKTRALFSEKTINELIEIKNLKAQGLPIKLIKNNYYFYSQTDTEVIVNLLQYNYDKCNDIYQSI